MRKTKISRQRRTLDSARRVVNQLTGFTLSDYHLASQIHTDGWAFLNPRSTRIDKASLKKIPNGSVIYVNSLETEIFVTDYLQKITANFVLISGEVWSPRQPRGAAVDTLLSHPGLMAWFTQNREDDDLPLKPFPFGVALRGITTVANAVKKHRDTQKEADVFVPYSALHAHLEGEAAETRKGLQPFMAEPQRHQDYLAELARHRFVISPAGDSPDTFRHWESVALGAIPISSLSKSFGRLFGDSIILVDDLVSAAKEPPTHHRMEADRSLATVDYWRKKVNRLRQGD